MTVGAKARPAVRKATAKVPRARAASARRVAARPLRLAGVGNQAVTRATGKDWNDWLSLLDRAGAKRMSHKDIALLLSRKFGVPDWWSQMVTVGYEQARGLREAHQSGSGYRASASRTVATQVDRLYDAWKDPRLRERWLPGAPIQVRRATDGKSMRITWTVGSTDVDVNFIGKGPEKSMVQVQHGKLASAASVTRQKAFWAKALERLKALLES